MGGGVITRTYDADLIKSVAKSPAIWATVAEDEADYDAWEPDIDECWLRADDDKGLIGLFNYHQFTGSSAQVHPMVLIDRRGTESVTAGIESLGWIFQNTDCIKVVSLVPEMYRNVILYALKCWMAKEAKISSIYVKNGKIHDMVMLSISRSEFEAKYHEQDR